MFRYELRWCGLLFMVLVMRFTCMSYVYAVCEMLDEWDGWHDTKAKKRVLLGIGADRPASVKYSLLQLSVNTAASIELYGQGFYRSNGSNKSVFEFFLTSIRDNQPYCMLTVLSHTKSHSMFSSCRPTASLNTSALSSNR